MFSDLHVAHDSPSEFHLRTNRFSFFRRILDQPCLANLFMRNGFGTISISGNTSASVYQAWLWCNGTGRGTSRHHHCAFRQLRSTSTLSRGLPCVLYAVFESCRLRGDVEAKGDCADDPGDGCVYRARA